MPRIAILLPLAVGASAVVCTILLHALAVSATVHFVRHARTRGRTSTSVWSDLAIVALVVAFAFVAHLLAIAVWAVVFLLCGEFPAFGTAYYHSAVNYTTLGYGDMIMTPVVALARTARSHQWSAHVRGVDRDHFYGDTTVD
jgi:hypothetical protein